MKKSRMLVRAALAMTSLCVGCGPAPESTDAGPLSTTGGRAVTFEAFLGTVHQDVLGRYIYEGDLAARDMEELRQVWEQLYPRDGALTVSKYNGLRNDVWQNDQQLNLTYCVSNNFGGNKQAVVNALSTAGAAWGAKVRINYVYVPAQDANCTASNGNVVFNVDFFSDPSVLASSFMPRSERPDRTLYISDTAFRSGTGWSLAGLVTHELGHTLGFRHEFLQLGGCPGVPDPGEWVALTPYDAGSIMHYPWCGGTNTTAPSQSDMEGAAQEYGSRVFASPSPPPSTSCGLSAGQGLGRGQFLESCGRTHMLHFQPNGTLVLYNQLTWAVIWSSNTGGQAGYGAYMQSDGNLVIYTGLGRPIWHSNTYGNPGSTLKVQNDGNVVISSPSGQALWSTGTAGR
jgi:hypothetical protein